MIDAEARNDVPLSFDIEDLKLLFIEALFYPEM
jgi:hypothetical protein